MSGKKNLIKHLFLLLLLLGGFGQPICASVSQEPQVSVEITPDTCLIGDVISYKLKVLRPASVSVAYPTENDTIFSPFEISEIKKRTQEEDSDLELDELEYSMVAFETGDLALPAISLHYMADRTAAEGKIVEVPGKMITVQSALDSASQAMADIKPIKSASFPIWIVLAILGALALIAVLVYWGYQKYKQKETQPEIVEEKPVPPYEWAKAQLKPLQSFAFSDQASYKTYYSQMSDIMRGFIERYYQMPAHERLTFEIVGMLTSKASSQQIQLISTILEKSDMVKFAKYFPSKIEADKSLEQAFSVIDVSKPSTNPETKTDVIEAETGKQEELSNELKA